MGIYKKLFDFQLKKPVLKLDSEAKVRTKKGSEYTFKFASLPNVLNCISPILNELGLFLEQPIINEVVYSKIIDIESGECIESSIKIPDCLLNQQINELDIQKIGSVITFFRRYTLCSLLALHSDEDEDANIVSGNFIELKTNLIDNNELETVNNNQKKPTKKLTREAYTKLLSRIVLGEKDLIDKALEEFVLTEEQKNELIRLKN